MLRRYRAIPLLFCIVAVFRPTLFFRHIPIQRMSKSIKQFFVTTKAESSEYSSNKKARTETCVSISKDSIGSELDVKSNVGALVQSTETKQDDIAIENTAVVENAQSTAKLGWIPFDEMEPGWKASLAREFDRPYFKTLLAFLSAESKSQTIFPPAKDIFTAFNLCPLDQVKVNYNGGL